MGKVTYCKDGFSFDSNFGFTGSAQGRADPKSHPQKKDAEYGDGLAKGGKVEKMASGGIPHPRNSVPGISRAAPAGAAPSILAAILKHPIARAAAAQTAARMRAPSQPPIAGAVPVPREPVPGMKKGGKFIQKMGLKKGALHRQLGVPESEKIPERKLSAAASGRYGALAEKRAHTAETLKGLHHGKKKG